MNKNEAVGNSLPTAASELAPAEFETEVDQPTPDTAEADVYEWDPTVRNRFLRQICYGLTALENKRREAKHNGEARRAMRKVSRKLEKACGTCGLKSSCEIAGDAHSWYDAHKTELPSLTLRVGEGEESRSRFLQRIKDNPQAPCIPPSRRRN